MTVPVETPLREDFDNSRGQFTSYDVYDPTIRNDVLAQKHVDIRSFVQESIVVGKPIWMLEPDTMATLNSQTMSQLDADLNHRNGEQWTAGTVGRQSDRNNWRGISLACTAGTNTTSSVIYAPSSAGVFAPSVIEQVDLLTDFDDTAKISIALPAFPLSSITTSASFVDFTSEPNGDFTTGPTVSVPFNASEVTLINGDSELRFFRSKLDLADARPDTFDQSSPPVAENFLGVQLDRITGVRFRIQATGNCTFRAMAFRLLDPAWQFTDVDMDTRYGLLRSTTSRTGATATAKAFAFPTIFRAQDPSSKDDPRPIDGTVEIIFNTGSLAGAYSDVNQNSISVFYREASLDSVTQLDLDGTPMKDLTGKPLPESSAPAWQGKSVGELDHLSMRDLSGTHQIDMEREPDITLANWQEFKLSWTAQGFASIKDSDGNGYSFGPFSISPKTKYLAVFSLESYTGRIVVYTLDESNHVVQPAVFDTNLVIDDFVLRRRRGRMGWKFNFIDGDVEIHSIRTRDLNYAEYRSAALESLTPVEGASLVVAQSEPKNLLTGWEVGPFGGRLRIDTQKSTSGNAIRVEPDTDGATTQGLWTNFLDFTNINSTDISFNLWYPSGAKDVPLRGYLFNELGASIPVSLGRILYDEWFKVKISPGLVKGITLGKHRFALLRSKASNLYWWVDNASVSERKVDWYARGDQSDAFHDKRVDWVPFRHLVNVNGAGVAFDRGFKLQVSAIARRQDAQIGRIQAIPRYAQLGRFSWSEDALTGLLPPYAQFSYIITDKSLFLNGFESYDPQGEIISYEWAFGDGGHSWGGTQTHIYVGDPQTYSIALTVTNQYGLRTTTSKLIAL